jgi:hypothetical protein
LLKRELRHLTTPNPNEKKMQLRRPIDVKID